LEEAPLDWLGAKEGVLESFPKLVAKSFTVAFASLFWTPVSGMKARLGLRLSCFGRV
jgi:hypothetical protein